MQIEPTDEKSCRIAFRGTIKEYDSNKIQNLKVYKVIN